MLSQLIGKYFPPRKRQTNKSALKQSEIWQKEQNVI
jgi:hypothetical protein